MIQVSKIPFRPQMMCIHMCVLSVYMCDRKKAYENMGIQQQLLMTNIYYTLNACPVLCINKIEIQR